MRVHTGAMNTTQTLTGTARPNIHLPVMSTEDQNILSGIIAQNTERTTEAQWAEIKAETEGFRHQASIRACRRIWHKLNWMVLDGQAPGELGDKHRKSIRDMETMIAWLQANPPS